MDTDRDSGSIGQLPQHGATDFRGHKIRHTAIHHEKQRGFHLVAGTDDGQGIFIPENIEPAEDAV
jgi:hypothetical protein